MDNFKFKKAYGQNFLMDDNIIKNIVFETKMMDNNLVIEIGPGSGNLTKELSKNADMVLAYEIDTRLEDILDETLKDCHNVDIIFDDFLKRDIKEDLKKYEFNNLYIIANLPYYITTPIITKIVESNISVQKITIMIQKEVGDRFNAKPGTRNYGSITVFLNYYYSISKLFDVSRNCFMPKPNVDSVVICLESKKERAYLKNEELFFKLINDAFRFKRKNLRNNLKNYDLGKIESVLLKYQKDLTARAEELSLEIFIDIANELS